MQRHIKKLLQRGGYLSDNKGSVLTTSAKGGIAVGAKHGPQGGIKAIVGTEQMPIEFEGEEIIITAPAASDPTLHKFEGKKMTKRQILSAINVDAGGNAFADGGEVPGSIRALRGKTYKTGGKTMSSREVIEFCGGGCAHSDKMQAGGSVKDSDYETALNLVKKLDVSKNPSLNAYAGKYRQLIRYIQEQATGLDEGRTEVDAHYGPAFASMEKHIDRKTILACIRALTENEKKMIRRAWKGYIIDPQLRAAVTVSEKKEYGGQVYTMSFDKFFREPRQGQFLEALRTVPKVQKTEAEFKADAEYDAAARELSDKGLGHLLVNSSQAYYLKGTKAKLWKKFKTIEENWQKFHRENQISAQKSLYERAINHGVIINPDSKGHGGYASPPQSSKDKFVNSIVIKRDQNANLKNRYNAYDKTTKKHVTHAGFSENWVNEHGIGKKMAENMYDRMMKIKESKERKTITIKIDADPVNNTTSALYKLRSQVKKYGSGGSPSNFVSGKFTLSHQNFFLGYQNPSVNWNGWAVPYFEKDVAIQILKNFKIPFKYEDEKLLADVSWDEEREAGSEEYEEILPVTITIDGQEKEVYSVGGRYWIWDELWEDNTGENKLSAGGPMTLPPSPKDKKGQEFAKGGTAKSGDEKRDFVTSYAPVVTMPVRYETTNKITPASFIKLIRVIRPFIPEMQLKALTNLFNGEEQDAAWEIADRLADIIKHMPHTYQTENISSDDKIVYLHYFYGGSDWYIVEKDMGDSGDEAPGMQHQAYGFSILNGDTQSAEWGYISIEEIKSNRRIELDFYWTPKKFKEVRKKWDGDDNKIDEAIHSLSTYSNKSVSVSLTSYKTKLYRENEDSNYHNENYLLLAETAGDPTLIKAAKILINETDNQGGFSINSPLYNLRNKLMDIFRIQYADRPTLTYQDNQGESQTNKIEEEFAEYFESEPEETTVLIAVAPEPVVAEEKPAVVSQATTTTVKQQAVINEQIRSLVKEKGSDRSKYSAEQITMLRLYEGAGSEKKTTTSVRILDQFFTPQDIIAKMWGIAFKHGFSFKAFTEILEPSVGSGRFLAYIPPNEPNLYVRAYDVDEICVNICKILYPSFDIRHASFETEFFKQKRHVGLAGVDTFYDLVIGNPPYRDYISPYSPLGEKDATGATTFEMYFIGRGVDVLKPSGLLIYIIPNSFLSNDNKYNDFKERLSKRADLIDAYRLPNGVFGNTDVGTDIIVLRKKQ